MTVLAQRHAGRGVRRTALACVSWLALAAPAAAQQAVPDQSNAAVQGNAAANANAEKGVQPRETSPSGQSGQEQEPGQAQGKNSGQDSTQGQTIPITDAVRSNDQVRRGRYLVILGDCSACHTVNQEKPLAGGLYMDTPFGRIPTPNLTPDRETGIGTWTDDQFYRALHTGIDNNGDNLYPAFPYEWFTHVTKEDVAAIKAYLFSLPPIHEPRKKLELVFPFNIRAAIGPWNALYFKPATFEDDPKQSPEWNRGRYIAEGLGHCSDCHTPKNVAMAPITSEAYAGNRISNWYAPNLTSDTREGLGAWSIGDIVSYLKTGQARGKTVAIGPMSQEIHESSSQWTDADLHAVAVYLKSIPAKESYKPGARGNPAPIEAAGLEIYSQYCSSCHQADGKGLTGAVPALAQNGAVTAKGPEDVIRAVLGGVAAQDSFSPMPGFATVLSSQQIADVTNYVRTAWGNGAPATATGALVDELAPQTRSMMAGTLKEGCTKPAATPVDQAITREGSPIPDQLRAVNDVNMINQITTMIGEIKKTVPDAKQADIINGLTNAYCPYVLQNPQVPAAIRAPTLDRFAVLTYTQLADKGRK